jgi:hypothetical protein
VKIRRGRRWKEEVEEESLEHACCMKDKRTTTGDEGAPWTCPPFGLRVDGILQADTRHRIPNRHG